MMKKLEAINVGDKAEISHKITKSDIEKFVDLTGDDNKLHIDSDYAKKTIFKKPVVHGMLGASFISTIIGTKLPGDGALWFSQNIEFIKPIRIGDLITVKAEVINKIERTQTIELTTDIFNQHNQKVIAGTAKVKVIEQTQLVDTEKPLEEKRKVALVIGATGGIGKATCLQLAKDGFDIGIHYRLNKELAEEIHEKVIEIGRKAIIVSGDINEFDQVKEMCHKIIRKFDTITVVAN